MEYEFMTNLMFINLYGTILPIDGGIVLRNGFMEFLNRYKSLHVAICAYVPRDVAIHDLIKVGLLDKADKIYTLEDMGRVRIYNKERNDLMDYYPQPNIRAFARADFHINEDKAVVISSNSFDMVATDWYGKTDRDTSI